MNPTGTPSPRISALAIILGLIILLPAAPHVSAEIDDETAILTLARQAKEYLGQKDVDRSWKTLQAARTIADSSSVISDSVRIIVYCELGYCALWKHVFDSSAAFLHRALDYYAESDLPEDSLYGEVLFSLAKLNYARGDNTAARRFLLSAIEVLSTHLSPDHLYLATLYNNLTVLCVESFDIDLGLQSIERALDIRSHHLGPDHPLIANNLINKGNILLLLGEMTTAENAQWEGLRILESYYGPDNLELVEALSNLGILYNAQGKREKALTILRRAASICTSAQNENNPAVAEYLFYLAQIFAAYKDYAHSQVLLDEVLHRQIATLGEDNQRVARTRAFYSEILAAQNKNHEAIAMVELARTGFEAEQLSNPNLVQYFTALLIRPNLHLRNYSLAKELIGRLFSNSRLNYLNTFLTTNDFARYMGSIYAMENRSDSAVFYFRQYLTNRSAFMDRVFVYSSDRQKLEIIQAQPFIDNGLLTAAARSADPGLVELAAEMILLGKGRVIDALIQEKSLTRCSVDPYLRQIMTRHKYICTTIANRCVGSTFGLPDEVSQDDLTELFGLVDSLEVELSDQCQVYKDDFARRQIGVEDILSALPDNSVLLDFVRYTPIPDSCIGIDSPRDSNTHYLVTAYSSDDRYRLLDLGNAAEIDSLIFFTRELLDNSGVAIYNPDGQYYENMIRATTGELTRRLIEPCRDFIGAADNIYIGPDGALNLLPFDILPLEDSTYLIERFSTSYISRGNDLANFDAPSFDSKSVTIFANPDYTFAKNSADNSTSQKKRGTAQSESNDSSRIACLASNIASIPFSTVECAEISRCLRNHSFEVTELTGAAATEMAFKTMEPSPRILHLATHGFVCQNELASNTNSPLLKTGLILTGANRFSLSEENPTSDDGILTAFEISAADLTSTELVTLSACATGTGEVVSGEGVIGLRRAFQRAGANSLLMSLWKIPDKETSALMISFYSNWMNGQSKRTALREAARNILRQQREKLGHGHPFLWGGFVLVGNPD